MNEIQRKHRRLGRTAEYEQRLAEVRAFLDATLNHLESYQAGEREPAHTA
jgi:hypothetical protein